MRRTPSPRPLSSLRPLPWRLRLPAAALGALLGETLAPRGGTAAGALLAFALAVPAILRRHRAIGSAAAIAGLAALAGLALANVQAVARKAALGEPADVTPVSFVATVERVQPRRGFGGRAAAALDLRVVESGDGRMRPGDGLRLAVWHATGVWAAGDRIEGGAIVRRPRGLCNGGVDGAAAALWRRGIRWVSSLKSDASLRRISTAGRDPRMVLARARAATARAIDRALAPADAAVVRAIVAGDASGLPDELRDAYARTGTRHVLSVSGLHIAIVAGSSFAVSRALLVRLPFVASRVAPARLAAIAALAPAAAYALFAGAAVATVRSLLMAGLFLVGVALRRPADVLVATSVAALAICAHDAEAPFHVSFQLSFAAVLAIVGGMRVAEASPIGPWLRPQGEARVVARALGLVASAVVVSIAAGVGTAPLSAAHFGVIPVAGVLANLVVVPLVGWGALLLGLIGAAALFLSDAIAVGCFTMAGWCTRLAAAIAIRLAEAPGAALAVAAPSSFAAACWMIGVFGFFYARPSRRLAAALAGACLAVAVTGAERLAARDHMRVSFLDVGQGDAALLETPGAVALVDAGGAVGDFDSGSWVVVPRLRNRGITGVDALVLSHPQLDHYGGMSAVVRSFPVSEYVSTGAWSDSRSFVALDAMLGRAQVARRIALAEGTPAFALGDGEVEVLHPAGVAADLSANDASLVLGVRYGAIRVLLTGDVESRGERRLLQAGRDATATILKAPHHGSRTSSTEPFVRAVRPGVVVAGVGARNRFGLPSREVAARWRRYGAVWMETGRNGEVVAESDGQLVAVSSCREADAADEGRTRGIGGSGRGG
jgi:competence protein ComEC